MKGLKPINGGFPYPTRKDIELLRKKEKLRIITTKDSLDDILEYAEKADISEEEMKFKYSNIIKELKIPLIITILQNSGIDSIPVQNKIILKCVPYQKSKKFNYWNNFHKRIKEEKLNDKSSYSISKFELNNDPIYSEQNFNPYADCGQYRKIFEEIDESEYYKEIHENPENIRDYYSKKQLYSLNLNEINIDNSAPLSITCKDMNGKDILTISYALYREFAMRIMNRNFIEPESTSRKKIRKNLDSLFRLNELKTYIYKIMAKIENNNLRNYTDNHNTKIFQKNVIVKIYKGEDSINRLGNESKTLDFFQKNLLEFHTPKVYCHGRLDDSYILLMEHITGPTINKYLEKIKRKNSQPKIDLLKRILDQAIRIGVEGYVNNLDTLYGKLNEQKIFNWLELGIIKKLKTKKSKEYLQRIKMNYDLISNLLLSFPFLYNKDIPTKNWLIKEDEQICVIDFENTHIGPIQLDLVTLFEGKNSFELEEQDLIPILKYTCKKINDYNTKKRKKLSKFGEQDFIKTYFAASVHRNLSMAGTNKEWNNEKQIIKHLRRASYSTDKLQGFIEQEEEKTSLQNLGAAIYEFYLSHLQ